MTKILNILIGRITNNNIETKILIGTKLTDELIRDGWVELKRDQIPLIKIVVEGGRVKKIFSDQVTLRIECHDLDEVEDEAEAKKRLDESSKNLYSFNV